MNTILVDHRGGESIIPNSMIDEIREIFLGIDINLKNYVVKDIKKSVPLQLKKIGWSDAIRLNDSSKITISSMKNDIGLCMQTGNVGRIYADLLKLQALYTRGSIRAGIIIIPTATAAKKIGGNIASFERLQRELPIFDQVITMPIVIIGFYE